MISVHSAPANRTDQRIETPLDVAALFDAHAPFLLRTVQRLSGAGPHVEDIVQEVFLVAHRRRQEIEGGDDVRGWLYRVAQNLVRHHGRAIARQRRLQSKYREQHREPEGADAADTPRARRDQADLVHRCVATLPLKLREVFVLYELEAISAVAIATLVGIPENTARSRLRLARDRFRSAWADATTSHGGAR
jgi:RNA polymerase sigma-70 factor (ECF subfamily)